MGFIGKIISDHKPVNISGHEVILIRDYLNAPPVVGDYTQIQNKTAKMPAVYALDEDISSMRSAYPEIPIYGFWQLASFNRLIIDDYNLQVVYESDKSGFFVYLDDDGQVIETGEFLDGLFVGSDNVVGVLPTDTVQISVELDKLKLPANQCYSANEMRKSLSKVKKQRIFVRYSMLAVVVLLAYGVNKGLEHYYNGKMEYYNRVDKERRGIYKKYSLLVNEKLTKWPDQSDVIDRLLAISKISEYSIEIKNFNAEVRELVIKEDLPFDPKSVYPWLDTYHIPTGGWEVSWKTSLESESNE